MKSLIPCTRKIAWFITMLCCITGHQLFAQYCSVSFTTYSTCVGGNITNVTFAGINNTVPCLTGGGYRDFTSTISPGSVVKGASYPISVTIGGASWLGGTAVWIDFDKNGTFDPAEKVFTGTYNGTTTVFTGTVLIPGTAMGGVTTMRVVGNESSTPSSACGAQTYGEAQDYKIIIAGDGNNNASVSGITNLTNLNFCSGTHDVKALIRNSGKNIINSLFIDWTVDGVLQPTIYWNTSIDTLGGISASDTVITLGQVSFASNAARNIKVWTSMPNNVPDTVNTDDTITVSLQAKLNCASMPLSCKPTFSSWSSCIGGAVAAVNYAGMVNTTPCLTGGGYRDLTNSVVAPVVIPGQPYPVSITIGSSYPTGGGGLVWMDLNRNGTFEPSELMFTGSYSSSNPTPHTYSGTITIPSNVQSGFVLMRVIGREGSTPTTSCGASSYGEANDYLIYVGSNAPNNASVTQIQPATQSFCEGQQTVKARVKNSGSNIINSVIVNWTVDGIAQTPVYWSAPVDTFGGLTPNDTLIDLGSVLFAQGISSTIKVWTSMPNNVQDTINIDDTLFVSLQPKYNCVTLPISCTPAFTAYSTCIGGAITGVSIGSMNNISPCIPGGGYRDLTHAISAPVLLAGRPYPVSVTIGSTSYPVGGGTVVLVDINRNGIFEPSEQLMTGTYNSANPVPFTYTSNITIPSSVQTGYLLMRIIGREGAVPAGSCGALGYGEGKDYYIFVNNSATNNAAVTEIQPANQSVCTGTHTVKARIKNRGINVINTVSINWSIDGVLQTPLFWVTPIDTIGGQSASDTLIDLGPLLFSVGVPRHIEVWTSMPNNTADTVNFDDTLRVAVEPSVVGGCASYTLKTYCVPTFTQWTTSCVGGNISNVTFAGINKNTTCTFGSNYYIDYTTSVSPAVITPGKTYPVSITVGGGGYVGGGSIWIDYDHNGIFDASEQVFTSAVTGVQNPTNGNITIPLTVTSGYTTMRVLGLENTVPGAVGACNVGGYGEAQDFVIKINEKPLNNAAVTKHVAPKEFCPGNYDVKVRIANNGRNIINNVNVEWSINGQQQPSVLFNYPIDTLGGAGINDTAVTLGNVFFSSGVAQSFKVWTSMPNFMADTTNTDDTITFTLLPALSGTYTVGAGGNYTSFASLVNDLNAGGICGNAVFEVAAGSVFNEAPLVFVNTGNGTDSVIIRKVGAGANPIINSTGTASADDAAIDLRGAKNVIFDGIDVRVTGSAVEYGYRLTNTNSRGSSNNQVINTKIIMNRSNTLSVGLVQSSNNALGGGINSTSFAMSNHNNIYKNIRIENSYNGILLIGAYAYPDTNCIVTSEGNDTTIIGSTAANDIGNGTSFVYGIYLNNVRNSEISKCVIRNLTHTSTSAVQGIIVENTSSSGSYGNVNVFGNTVFNINRTNTSTTSSTHAHGIRIELGNTATANVYNNVVYAITSTGNTSSANANQAVRGISYGTATGTGAAYFYNNSVHINNPSLNRTSAAFWKSGTGNAVLHNNIFSNTTAAQTGVAKHFAVYRNSGSLTASNNLLWVANANGFVGYYGADQANMQNWKAASAQDDQSVFYRPAFISATNLKPNANDTAAWAINGRAIHIGAVSKDIAGNSRAASILQGTPDIGAYEFTPVSLPPQATPVPAVATPGGIQAFLFAEDTVAKLNWDINSAIPSSVIVRAYSGETPYPLSLSGHQVINSYYSIDMNPGSYIYTASVYYKNIWGGSIQNTADLKPATKFGSNPWSADFSGTADVTNHVLTTSTLYNTSSLMVTGAYQYDPLPVKLLDFSGIVSGSGVNLKWVTASEKNNKGFMIERSDDGRSFGEIDFVKANNNSKGQSAYLYTDKEAFGSSDVLYYRLKQVDIDGGFEYSNVVMVNRKDVSADVLSVYPNPFTDQLVLSADMPEAAQITITDISGRTVNADVYERLSGHVMINTSSLKAGVYFLHVNTGILNKTIKVIKQ